LQIAARFRMIGRELQSAEEILPYFGNPARPRFEHAEVVPVIGVIGAQMMCRLSAIAGSSCPIRSLIDSKHVGLLRFISMIKYAPGARDPETLHGIY